MEAVLSFYLTYCGLAPQNQICIIFFCTIVNKLNPVTIEVHIYLRCANVEYFSIFLLGEFFFCYAPAVGSRAVESCLLSGLQTARVSL